MNQSCPGNTTAPYYSVSKPSTQVKILTSRAVMFLIIFLTETVGSGTRAFVYVTPSSENWSLISRCAPKGYVICLLAVLNSRQSLRRDMSDESSFMVRFSSSDALI